MPITCNSRNCLFNFPPSSLIVLIFPVWRPIKKVIRPRPYYLETKAETETKLRTKKIGLETFIPSIYYCIYLLVQLFTNIFGAFAKIKTGGLTSLVRQNL